MSPTRRARRRPIPPSCRICRARRARWRSRSPIRPPARSARVSGRCACMPPSPADDAVGPGIRPAPELGHQQRRLPRQRLRFCAGVRQRQPEERALRRRLHLLLGRPDQQGPEFHQDHQRMVHADGLYRLARQGPVPRYAIERRLTAISTDGAGCARRQFGQYRVDPQSHEQARRAAVRRWRLDGRHPDLWRHGASPRRSVSTA